MTPADAAPSWPCLLVAFGVLWLSGRLLPVAPARTAAARGPGGVVGRGAMRRVRPADAGGGMMPTFSLPATIALAILAGCTGYFLAWIAGL
jgi:hypothetical protein